SPSGTFVPPQQFVPLAERSGAIVPMTWLVFDRVRESLPIWVCHAEPLSIAVNVSPLVLKHADFFSRLQELNDDLSAAEVDLIIELTEESLVAGDGATTACLERIRKLGIGLSIDDFG